MSDTEVLSPGAPLRLQSETEVGGPGGAVRALKPANVMVRASDGEPVLIDFGLARDADMTSLTKTGDVLGTPQYMSPEQVTGPRSVDSRTDLYSLGAMLFELATGEPVFRGIGT